MSVLLVILAWFALLMAESSLTAARLRGALVTIAVAVMWGAIILGLIAAAVVLEYPR